MIHDKMTQSALSIVAVIAALNWATVEFAQTDLLLDVVGLTAGSTEYQAVIGAIAVAALLVLYDRLVWVMDA